MFFKIESTSGQPLYLQLMQKIRHAVESGAPREGEQLPGIRTLAQELVVSPNTIAKAYSELEHEGLLELRQGSGAFVCLKRRIRSLTDSVHVAPTPNGAFSPGVGTMALSMKKFVGPLRRNFSLQARLRGSDDERTRNPHSRAHKIIR